jgi:hypothetical protein
VPAEHPNFLLVTKPGAPIEASMEWHGRIGSTDEVTLDQAAELLSAAPSRLSDLIDTASPSDIEIYRRRGAS